MPISLGVSTRVPPDAIYTQQVRPRSLRASVLVVTEKALFAHPHGQLTVLVAGRNDAWLIVGIGALPARSIKTYHRPALGAGKFLSRGA